MAPDPIDDSTADRLFSGRLAPEDAPSEHSELARVLRSAAGPADPAELSAREAMVPAIAAAVASAGAPPTPAARRKKMLSKLLPAKVGAIVVTSLFGAGIAAAAVGTGSLPTAAQSAVSTALSHVGVNVPSGGGSSSDNGAADTTTTAGASVVGANVTSTTEHGPGPNGSNDFGLCTAFLHGSANKDSAPPFKALMAAHGGKDGTTAYCKTVVATKPSEPDESTTSTTAGGNNTTTTSTTEASDHADGRPSNAGQDGQGSSHSTDNPGTTHRP